MQAVNFTPTPNPMPTATQEYMRSMFKITSFLNTTIDADRSENLSEQTFKISNDRYSHDTPMNIFDALTLYKQHALSRMPPDRRPIPKKILKLDSRAWQLQKILCPSIECNRFTNVTGRVVTTESETMEPHQLTPIMGQIAVRIV